MSILLRVDDIGRGPNDPPEAGTDHDLKWFDQWYRTIGLGDLPAVFAAVPTWIKEPGQRWLKENIRGRQSMGVHGWDHRRGARVTSTQMQLAISALATDNGKRTVQSYVPPYNEYGDWEIGEWSQTGRRYFFGGFNGEHHQYGELPKVIGDVVHLPAAKALYGRAGELHKRFFGDAIYQQARHPLVMTLHVGWDANNMSELAKLKDAISPYLIGWEELELWLTRTTLNRGQLTAPHFLAYSWILENLPPFANVLDFGSRYSVLPCQMALRGCAVVVADRDDTMIEKQGRLEKEYGVQLAGKYLSTYGIRDNTFDAVTACWAIQHNLESDQSKIAAELARIVKPGGKILVVSSFTSGDSFDQFNRADPQRVLNVEDHCRVVIRPSNCKLAKLNTFRYEHGTERGDWCNMDDANAVCYELQKPT